MTRRYLALPRLWLLTDERQGDALWPTLKRLPRHVGVIVRHYSLAPPDREALSRRIASRRFVAFSGSELSARRGGAKAVYGSGSRSVGLPRIYPVHSRREMVRAERAGAQLLMLSPVFPTRSHPGAPALGPVRFGLLARTAHAPVIALGGMTRQRFRRLGNQAGGWAAIDGWIRT